MSGALLWFLVLPIIPAVWTQSASYAPCKCPPQYKEGCECVFLSQCDISDTIIEDNGRPNTQRPFTEFCPDGERCCKVPKEVSGFDDFDFGFEDDDQVTTTRKPAPAKTVPRRKTPVTKKTTTTTTTSTTTTPIPRVPDGDGTIPIPPPNTEGGCGVRRISQLEDGQLSPAFGEFPWMVAVMNLTSRTVASYQCGGSLISHEVVLTSAHCVSSRSAEEVVVRAGDWNFASKEEPLKPQDRRVNTIIIHPQFNEHTLANDVALLELSKPLEPALNIDTICLPESDTDFSYEDCMVTSWGTQGTGRDDRGTVLHQLSLSVLGHTDCRVALRKAKFGKYFKLDKSFLCAVGNEDSACQADGGSPLMCRSSRDPQRYFQAGILVGGLGCAVREAPAIFTNMTQFSNWIYGELEDRILEYEAVHP